MESVNAFTVGNKAKIWLEDPAFLTDRWKIDAVKYSKNPVRRIHGALDSTGATSGPYKEGVGTRVCGGPRLLKPGDEKK